MATDPLATTWKKLRTSDTQLQRIVPQVTPVGDEEPSINDVRVKSTSLVVKLDKLGVGTPAPSLPGEVTPDDEFLTKTKAVLSDAMVALDPATFAVLIDRINVLHAAVSVAQARNPSTVASKKVPAKTPAPKKPAPKKPAPK